MAKNPFKSLSEEKAEIKRAMKTSFQEGAIWQPIALSWFEKWKTYVNYDDEVPEPREQELIESLHPGQIDNNSLQGSFGDEMRRDAVEGRDFILLPTSYAIKLFDTYGGGPNFPRKVLNVGQYYNPIYQVNLWPIRIEVYFCDRNQPTPVQTDDRFKRRYFSKNMKLDEVGDDLGRLFNTQRAYVSSRYWLRDTPPDVSAEIKKGKGRMLTCDVVDFDGTWRFVRSDANRNIQEVLGERDCIELIIEVAPVRNPRDSEWPRFQQLEAWKHDLRIDDMVDVKDRKGKFYAAKILNIDEEGNLKVHFFGWSDANDEKILASEIMSRVAPLHGHSFDRSKWEEGNKVDVRLETGDEKIPAVWVTGTIIGTDPKAEKVEVMVEAKDKQEALKSIKASSSSTSKLTLTSEVATLKGDVDEDDEYMTSIDDDALKKKRSSTDSIVAAMEEVKTNDDATPTNAAATETKTTDNENDDETLRLWVDVYGDAVAPQYTHTPPLRVSSGYGSNAYSSLYGNYGTGYASSASYAYDRHTKGTPPVAGAVGLQNLGNTCFMNSILQCLSNTQVLTEMFTSGIYRDQINYDNPLGHAGKIALTYGKLIKDMWSGAYTKVVPREFKSVIGDYRPQFAGYDQQDSQEMMSCLLDGLHEDLNRIKKKPYTQKIESKGRSDDLIASESWRRFLLRNDSLIVERFFGLQKSHVTCRQCGKESVTFDPYATLSVPIPVRNTRVVPVIVQLLPHDKAPIRVSLEVELTATMADCKKLLVDKLIELKLLSTEVADATVESGDTNTTTRMSTDDSYELVQKEDTLPCSETQTQTQNHHNKRKLHTVHDAKPVLSPAFYDALHFHFGVLYSTRTTNVSKNFNSQDGNAKNTAITAFVGKLDYLVAFQLAYPLPDFKSIGTYNYYYSSTYSSTSMSKKKTLLDELDDDKLENTDVEGGNKAETSKAEEYFGMDVVIGTREGMRIDLVGYPRRVACVLHQTTNADVHRTVRQMLKRLIPKDSPLWQQDETAWPYELLVTTTYGSQVHRSIEKNDALFTPLKENMEILVVHWQNSLVKDGLVQISRARELLDQSLSTTTTSSLNNNNNNNNSIDDTDDLDDDEYYPTTTYKTSTSQQQQQQQQAHKRAKKTLSIYDCFDKYIEREQLADTETVYCNRCKEMLAPIKKMDIWTAPDVLIVHLKRFQFIAGQYMVLREKINEVVDFPVEGLDLSEYVKGPVSAEAPPVYDLFAVSHHMGGLGGGHYTATAKNFRDNQWYYFNDSSVTPTDAASAVNATAYVLFYKRRTGALKWAGQVPHPEGLPDEADD